MRLAIIPARGGSKRIPRKNIRTFCGKPMIAWSIDAALKSGCFDEVIVSTDDGEIASISLMCGAKVPFMRPAELSDDHTGTIPVMAHAVDWITRNSGQVDLACCIYATAPFITIQSIRNGLQTLIDSNCDYAFAVTSYPYPIQRSLRITGKNRVEMLDTQHFNTRSQDLEEVWHDAGQFYWGTAQAWLAARPIFGLQSAPVILSRHEVQDIDTDEDWIVAEAMFNARNLLRDENSFNHQD